MNFWHIQMNQPLGRGDVKIDSKLMLLNEPPIIGTGDWDDLQCKDFKGENERGIKIDDIVLVREGKTPIAICKVKSGYFLDNDLSKKFKNIFFREVKVLEFFENNSKADSLRKNNLEKFKKTNIQASGTLTKCIGDNATNNFIKEWYQLYLKHSEMNNHINLLEESKNLIFTGAPGTGKTYLAKEIAKQIIGVQTDEELKNSDQFEFVQFHPSYDYTDFVEGLRPTKPDENGNIGFELKDGVFKRFCQIARESKNSVSNDNFEQAWEQFIDKVRENLANGKLTTIGSWDYGLSRNDSLKYSSINTPSQYSFTITKQNVYDTYQQKQARPSGAFERDMENVVRYLKDNFGLNDFQVNNLESEDQKKYIIIIDEINRGEISKIFGELFFSIDPSYRGVKGAVKTQYANLHNDEEEVFYIPENVYIIGTMNDIDRSVESFDFAMRRRFVWQEISAEDSAINMNLSEQTRGRMDSLNLAISSIDGLNASYHIGGAYFLDKDGNERTDYEDLWKLRLEPLLKEYLRGMPQSETYLGKLKTSFNQENSGEDNGQ